MSNEGKDSLYKSKQHRTPNPAPNPHITSKNSGRYHPAVSSDEMELETVQAYQLDIQNEEFPEGPYGAATNETELGKTSPWQEGQRTISAFRDQNPVSSNRKTVTDEPDWEDSRGTIEGEN
ncbi:hypothetical protein [Alicyclobacillus sp. SO9]|uniref:hypothetical protein n=1 Tax=Alicyclobacillus sp. SO9 TaxID=2665646 RepID=UPI0018E79641|nr:hypothetical protein [Alicyclobacillus sp. SO9]QQE77044.1 hypothetical protein GI364_13770 [Alicyclobacillus sp. SO9]